MPDQGLTTEQLDKIAGTPLHMQAPQALIPGASKVMGNAISGVMEVLNRPSEATLARSQGRPFWHTLFHGETPTQYQSDTEAVTRGMMGASPQEFAKLNPVRKAANEFAAQMITDPTSYLGGTGILRHVLEEAGLHVIPAAVKAGPKLAPKVGTALHDAFNLMGEASGWVHDQMTPGGKPVAHAIRELAGRYGAEGMKQAQRMMSAASGSRSVAGHFGAVGKQLMDEALHGVPQAAQSAIFKAIHEGSIDKLPAELRPVADQLVRADRSILWIMGTKTVRKWLTDRGFTLPKEFAPFDKGPQGRVSIKNVRENHVPMAHELDDEERQAAFASLNQKPGARALTDVRNRFFKARKGEPNPGWENDPEAAREVWAASFRSAGRQLGGAQLRRDLTRLFGTPPARGAEYLNNLGKAMQKGEFSRKPLTIKDLTKMAGEEGEAVPLTSLKVTRTRGNAASGAALKRLPSYIRQAYGAKPPIELTPPQKVLRALEQGQNIWKGSLFYTPTGHQKNIATLLALADPKAFPTAMANYVRLGLGFGKPSKRMAHLEESIRAGAVPFSNLEQSGLTDLLQRFGPLGKAASKWYGGVGKMLWGWDQAVKDALYKSELKHFGGDAGRAAASVRRKLVDYEQSTAFQELMRTVAPFATWRTAMPQAVLTSLRDHPEYALGLNRATGGALAGQPFSIGGQQYQSTNPLEEVNELTDPTEAHKYVRSALSLPARLGADAIAKAFGLSQMPYPAPALEQYIPGANPYGDTPGQEALFAALGIHKFTPPKWHRHRPPRRKRKGFQGSWLGIPLP